MSILYFEIYDVRAWLTMNYNTHIPQYLTNQRHPDNEISSVNRISQEKYFFKKYAENEAKKLVPVRFLFFKKLCIRLKQVICSLISLYLDSPQISIQQKQTV